LLMFNKKILLLLFESQTYNNRPKVEFIQSFID
jgi:hypothetical protein